MSATVSATGENSFDSATGTWFVKGAGALTTSAPYNFYFKYMPLTGDFTVTARVLTQEGNHANARAGLAAAEAVTGTFNYAWTARYSNTGEIRSARQGNNGSAISGFSTSELPVWVRIRRTGNTLYTEASTDGVTFTSRTPGVTTTQDIMYVGFAVSSNNNTTAVQASFDQLKIEGGGFSTP